MAASFLTLHYGAPVMLFALLLGMAFNFVDPAGKFEPGVTFSSKTLLRLGVALLGVKVTLANMTELGLLPLGLAVCGVLLTMGLGVVMARVLGRNAAFGILSGGAVGICGASAALAISSVLPRGEKGISERDIIFTVVLVTALSTVAMVLYPIFTKIMGLTDIQAVSYTHLDVYKRQVPTATNARLRWTFRPRRARKLCVICCSIAMFWLKTSRLAG